jgi:uncharacterized protein
VLTTNSRFRHILVVGQSARMLSQLATSAGFMPLAIDCYGDRDMRTYAQAYQRIASMAEEDLMPALDYFLNQYPVTRMVYGSGFERHVDSLKRISSRLNVLGNHPDVFASLLDKPKLFRLLSPLQIPYPTVSFRRPDNETGWLVKPMDGHGGVGIKRYGRAETIEPSSYWQRYQEGVPHSVLFLADGKRSQIVGFNRQWTTALNEKDEFIFSGIINSTTLSKEEKAGVSTWVTRLVPELSLKGLNSLDFIQHKHASYALEINPRPPASMQLYDADLFVRHIKACQGELFDYQPQAAISAYQVVFARQDTQIPDRFEWPEGVVDVPIANAIISTGQPICSMIVRGKEPDEVLRQLQIGQELIINQLDRLQTHGIQRQRQ